MYLDQMTMTSFEEYDDDTLSELEREALGFNLTYDLASQIRKIQTKHVLLMQLQIVQM